MISVRNITKNYGNVKVIDDLSFDVGDGLITGFLGPNGSGKSTTMRMILGLDKPTNGEILVNGKNYVDLVHPFKEIGALLDAKLVHPKRSARSHLKWICDINNIDKKRIDIVLEQVGLTSVADKNAGKFSLGMSQRLGIASALLGDPQTIMLDEPVNGLDPNGILWIRNFLKTLAKEGRTVFVSSHLLTEMSLMADHVIIIGQGKKIKDCEIDDFTNNSKMIIKLNSDNNEKMLQIMNNQNLDTEEDPLTGKIIVHNVDNKHIGKLAYDNDVIIYELESIKQSLEEVYMELTNDQVQYHGGK